MSDAKDTSENTGTMDTPWDDLPPIPEPQTFEDDTSVPRLKEIIRALQTDGRRAFLVEQQGDLGQPGSRIVFTYVADNEVEAYKAIVEMLRKHQMEDPEIYKRVEEYAGTAYSAAFLLDKFIDVMRAVVGSIQTDDKKDRKAALSAAIRLLGLWDSDPDTEGMRAWVKMCSGHHEASARGEDIPRFLRVSQVKQ